MLLLRRILFYLFALIYLTFCPIIILYALGYIYKPDSEKAIVKSGLIYLSTVPQGATVYLENRRFFRHTPVVLSNLVPGEYQVRVVRKKYEPWTGTLPVEAGKATVLERILLLPAGWKPKILSDKKIQSLVPILGSRFFLLKESGEKLSNFSLYDWKDDEKSALMAPGSVFGESRVLRLFHVEKSQNLVLSLDSKEGKKYLWVGLKTKEPAVKDISSLVSGGVKEISWPSQEKRYVYTFDQNNLTRLDLVQDATSANFLTGVLGYGFFDRKLYVLKNDFTLERMDLDGKSEKVLFQDPVLGPTLFSSSEFYHIRIFSEDFFSEPIILFLSDSGELLANRLPYRFVEKGIKGLEFNSRTKSILIWTENAIGVLDFSKSREAEEQVFEPAPKLVWLVKGRNQIKQAFWVYEGSHVLFRDQDRLFLLELENYSAPALHELFSVKKDSSIYYSEDLGKIFYLEPGTGYLSSAQLLPRWEILTPSFLGEKLEERKFTPPLLEREDSK